MMDLIESMTRLNAILDNGDEESEAADLFREIFILHDYEKDGNRKIGTVECGSIETQTVEALYRLLYLAKPKRVDFSDMYKSSSLFALRSPDWEFVADIQFYKYELAIYFSAAKQHVEGHLHGVQSGLPGSDNGIRAKTPELKEWMVLLTRCVERRWLVYLGNDFEV